LIRATAASPAVAYRQAMWTRPPSRASAMAVASPIPVLPPVMRKVRPADAPYAPDALDVVTRSR
jgi:hypothetical protein